MKNESSHFAPGYRRRLNSDFDKICYQFQFTTVPCTFFFVVAIPFN